MEFSRQEYSSGLPFSPPGDLPDPGMEPTSPALTGGLFTTEPQNPYNVLCLAIFKRLSSVYYWLKPIVSLTHYIFFINIIF